MSEYKVKLVGKDGKEYHGNFDWLRDELGINNVRDYLAGRIGTLFERLIELEEYHVNHILQPEMEANILSLLKENPELKTREINQKSPNNRLEMHAWYFAFKNLEQNGRIIPTSHGQGHNRTWRVKEEA